MTRTTGALFACAVLVTALDARAQQPGSGAPPAAGGPGTRGPSAGAGPGTGEPSAGAGPGTGVPSVGAGPGTGVPSAGAGSGTREPSAVPGEVILIDDERPDHGARDRDRALGDAPFVTVLHAGDHAPTASVADAIATSAGAQTRSLGGLGAFASVSVRGAAPGHTAVLIDGVPLARIAAVTADLGRFAMDTFGQVELYRGAVPAELGGAGVGGAVNLITRLGRGDRGERIRASLGAGSFGARHVRAHYGDDHGGAVSSATLGYQAARGDFAYFSDGGTPLNPDDDGTAIRRNNRFDQVDFAARLGTAARDRTAGARVLWKRQGLPGSVAQPADAAELTTLDAIVDARGELRAGAATGRQLGYLLVERQLLRDPMAELGLGSQDRGYLTVSGGAATTWARRLAGRVRGSAGLELRGDRFRDGDRSGARAALVGTRGAGALTLAADLAIDRAVEPAIVVTPALRVDLVRTAPTPVTEGPDAFAAVPPRWDTVASPRLTGRARVAPDVTVKASAGYYVRLPTLVELFGNRGTILGAPGLRPERGPSGDAGVVWAPAGSHHGVDRILVEAAAFATRARDTIALITSAGFVARAANAGATRSHGGELVASARLARTVSLAASYTRLVTAQRSDDVNLDGRVLPRSPGHQLYARVDAGRRIAGRDAALWLDVAAQSTAYVDQANFQRVPARALIGAGARLGLAGGVALAISVDNLGDARVVELPADRPIDPVIPAALTDLAGFPLPGRSFYLSLDWTH